MSDTATVAATVAATEHDVEAARIERHRRFRSNTLPALVTVGPVTLWLLAFIAVPLLYILIMGFCSTDQYYNVVYSFTLDNFQSQDLWTVHPDRGHLHCHLPGFGLSV